MRRSVCAIAFATAVAITQNSPQAQSRTALSGMDAIKGILEAFKTHDLVAIPDAHGNAESHAFRLALIKDPRFAAAVDDVVIEIGNARYQDVADRYVRGEDVALEDLRRIWRDTTVTTAANNYDMAKQLLDTVRAVNRSRRDSQMLRVVLGDPPIEWDRVRDRADYQRYFQYRQSHPVAVVLGAVELLVYSLGGRKAILT